MPHFVMLPTADVSIYNRKAYLTKRCLQIKKEKMNTCTKTCRCAQILVESARARVSSALETFSLFALTLSTHLFVGR